MIRAVCMHKTGIEKLEEGTKILFNGYLTANPHLSVQNFRGFRLEGFTLLIDWPKWTFWCMTLKIWTVQLSENLMTVFCTDSYPQQMSSVITTISVMLLIWTRYFDALLAILFSQGAPTYNIICRSVKSWVKRFIQNPFINFEKVFLTNWRHSISRWLKVICFSIILQTLTSNKFVWKTVNPLTTTVKLGLANTNPFQCL